MLFTKLRCNDMRIRKLKGLGRDHMFEIQNPLLDWTLSHEILKPNTTICIMPRVGLGLRKPLNIS